MLERNAETKKEFIEVWNLHVDNLSRFRPTEKDQERLKELQTELKQMIARKANSTK